MEWRWNNIMKKVLLFVVRLNPCSNGMALERATNVDIGSILTVLILVLMEWRWNINYSRVMKKNQILS